MLRLYKRSFAWKQRLSTILFFFILLVAFWCGFGQISQENDSQGKKALRAAIHKSIVSCYANEGVYPQSIDYLEEHYGIVINHNRYIVRYEPAGDNVMPSVEVLERGEK